MGQNPGWEHGLLGPEGGRRGGETRSGLEPRDAATWVVWDGAARGPGEMPAAQTAAGRPPVRPRWPARCEEGGPRGGPHPAADGRAPALFVMGQCRHGGGGSKTPPRTSATPAPDGRSSFSSPQWVAAPATEPTLTVGPSRSSFPFRLPSATPNLSPHAALQVKKLWTKAGPQSNTHTKAGAAAAQVAYQQRQHGGVTWLCWDACECPLPGRHRNTSSTVQPGISKKPVTSEAGWEHAAPSSSQHRGTESKEQSCSLVSSLLTN